MYLENRPDLSHFDADELWSVLVGRVIDEGVHRKVYEVQFHEGLVLKMEKSTRAFHNVREWEVWNNVSWSEELAKWFAPCVAISSNGKFLLQKRTRPVRIEDMPALCPKCLTDKKVQNFGWYDGRVVAHDYSFTLPNFERRLVKGKWWDDVESRNPEW